jgi:Flp pilus assembly protein CpaB
MATGGRRRGRVLIFVALILILLVVLAWAVTRFLNPFTQLVQQPQQAIDQAPTAPVVEMTNIVISVQPIQRGREITSDVITTIPFPRAEFVEGAFITDPESVIGKRAKVDIEARMPLNTNLLVDASIKNSPPAFQIPRGQVAISIPISNLSAVSYGLQSGDHVNVIVTLLMTDLDVDFQSRLPNLTCVVTAPGTTEGGPTTKTVTIANCEGKTGRTEIDSTLGEPVFIIPSESPRPRLVTQTLIQDAVVLQSGKFAQPSETQQTDANQAAVQPTPAPGQQATTVAPTYPDTITLIVNPQDAVTLNYLIVAGGKLNLVMRAAGDDSRVATEAVTLQFVLDQYNIPNPAKLPYGLEPRLDAFPSLLSPFPYSSPNLEPQPTTPPQ